MIANCNIYNLCLSSYNQIQSERCDDMSNEPLKIKKRGDDGNKVITVRIKEETVSALDRIANESNYSRNELINIMLEYGVKNIQIEK